MTTDPPITAETHDEKPDSYGRPLRVGDPRGTNVIVTLDGHLPWLSVTRSRVFRARGGVLRVMLEGREGSFVAAQCEVLTEGVRRTRKGKR